MCQCGWGGSSVSKALPLSSSLGMHVKKAGMDGVLIQSQLSGLRRQIPGLVSQPSLMPEFQANERACLQTRGTRGVTSDLHCTCQRCAGGWSLVMPCHDTLMKTEVKMTSFKTVTWLQRSPGLEPPQWASSG